MTEALWLGTAPHKNLFPLTGNEVDKINKPIDHFTVVCLVAWPLNEFEAGGDFVFIETSLLFFCKLPLISMRTASLT